MQIPFALWTISWFFHINTHTHTSAASCWCAISYFDAILRHACKWMHVAIVDVHSAYRTRNTNVIFVVFVFVLHLLIESTFVIFDWIDQWMTGQRSAFIFCGRVHVCNVCLCVILCLANALDILTLCLFDVSKRVCPEFRSSIHRSTDKTARSIRFGSILAALFCSIWIWTIYRCATHICHRDG